MATAVLALLAAGVDVPVFLLDRPEWFGRAACRGRGTELYFIPAAAKVSDEAMAMCTRCPVRSDCLRYATANALDGIWAGTTPRQRRAMAAELGIEQHQSVDVWAGTRRARERRAG